MTGTEMEQEFLILYDKVTSFDAPGYTPLEISVFLTKAQERVVLRNIRSLGNKYQEGFEESEIRRKELNELVRGVTIVTPSTVQNGVVPNGEYFDLPADFMIAISEEITTASSSSCNNGKRLMVKPVTHDEIAINRNNPFKKPSILRYVWRLDHSGDKHELVTDASFSVAEYHLRYLKTLTPIVIGTDVVDGATGPLDCELNSIMHKQIIDEAVKIATGVTDPEKYQIKTIEQQAGN